MGVHELLSSSGGAPECWQAVGAGVAVHALFLSPQSGGAGGGVAVEGGGDGGGGGRAKQRVVWGGAGGGGVSWLQLMEFPEAGEIKPVPLLSQMGTLKLPHPSPAVPRGNSESALLLSTS